MYVRVFFNFTIFRELKRIAEPLNLIVVCYIVFVLKKSMSF